MITAIQRPTMGGQDDLIVSPASDPQKKTEGQGEAVDYRISFQKEVVDTLTYNRTAWISLNPVGDGPGFEELLSRLLLRQGVAYEEALGGKTVDIDPETRAEAQTLVDEDGYWGIAKTSERIFKFAIAGAGGDPAKLEEIKAAISKGFDMARETLGGALPDISSKTFDAVMSRFDDWAGTAA